MELRVLLGERDVGVIRSQRDGRTEFVFSSDYLTAGERPVLGQYFEDHLDTIHRSQTQLPAFFSPSARSQASRSRSIQVVTCSCHAASIAPSRGSGSTRRTSPRSPM
jgi:hypothetical protein